jgi:transcriptional regulator with XRE-family HTH domain
VEKSIHSPEYDRLVAVLRELREEAGLHQAELAERLEATQTWVSKYENGERRLDLVQLHWVCQALGVSVGELVRRWERLQSQAATEVKKRR